MGDFGNLADDVGNGNWMRNIENFGSIFSCQIKLAHRKILIILFDLGIMNKMSRLIKRLALHAFVDY